jgi:hypothetical protein
MRAITLALGLLIIFQVLLPILEGEREGERPDRKPVTRQRHALTTEAM